MASTKENTCLVKLSEIIQCLVRNLEFLSRAEKGDLNFRVSLDIKPGYSVEHLLPVSGVGREEPAGQGRAQEDGRGREHDLELHEEEIRLGQAPGAGDASGSGTEADVLEHPCEVVPLAVGQKAVGAVELQRRDVCHQLRHDGEGEMFADSVEFVHYVKSSHCKISWTYTADCIV